MLRMTERRGRFRWAGPAAAGLIVLAGCTSTSGPGTGSTTDGSGPSTSSGSPTVTAESSVARPSATDPVTTAVTTSGDAATAAAPSETTEAPTVTPTLATYTPPVDAEATEGECPYLTTEQVQADTGQRMGPTRIRAAAPAPVCEFIRNDGGFLATVRVLQLDSDANAVAAVDFYIPRETSNPETRPAGWAGGSLASDDGSTYGVSKGTYAVIAATNQKQSVYARLLVVNAIENLGL